MPAIKPHSTLTTSTDWDGAEAVRRLRSGEEPEYYARVFAWRDPEADPRTKGAYKLPHHEVTEDGEPGAANLKACAAAIAVLNGARGGADIPQADREGVYEHLAGHYRDAGEEPPELAELAAAGETVRLAGQFELAASAKSEDRTARVVWYSGAPVQRSDFGGAYELQFSMEPGAVRLDRLNNGAPLLRAHNDDDLGAVIGVVTRAWLDRGRGLATVRFSRRSDVDSIWQDVQDGVIRNASMGVVIHAKRELPSKDGVRRYLVTDWEPLEISLVPIPADPGAGFKASIGGDKRMSDQTTTQQQQTNAQAIRRIVLAAKLPESFADGLVAAGASLEQARKAIFDKLASDYERAPTRSHAAVVTRDYREGLVERMSEALACRYTAKQPSEGAREWMSVPLHELARECLAASGRHVTTRQPGRIIELAMTTEDFPNLLKGTGERILLDAYQTAQSGIKRICRIGTAQSFREQQRLRVGEAPALLQVAEGGEITYGSMEEAKATFRIATYARIVALTKQALTNDDLGAFADLNRAFGIAAASSENKLIVDTIGLNANAYDGTPLFHANHGNLAGTGGAISIATLDAGSAAMMRQKGLDNATVLNIPPLYLVVPVSKRVTAFQFTNPSNIVVSKQADLNPFAGQLEVITDAMLDDYSATAWYLFAEPSRSPVLEFAYLEGAQGPSVDTRQGWNVDGMEFRCRLYCGVGVLDWRGAYRNDGA